MYYGITFVYQKFESTKTVALRSFVNVSAKKHKIKKNKNKLGLKFTKLEWSFCHLHIQVNI